jgi:nuclear pore complex protein Nup205
MSQNPGKVKVLDEEYSINKDFQETVLRLADELDLDEVEAAKVLLEAEEDQDVLGRSLLECGVIRFHQQRKYLLNCMRLCIQIAKDDELEGLVQDFFGGFVTQNIYGAAAPCKKSPERAKRIIPRCVAAMQDIKAWLQMISDKMTTTAVMYQANVVQPLEFQEAIEFSRVSLVQQHENLALILCSAIEDRQAEVKDFEDFLKLLKRIEKYDNLLGERRYSGEQGGVRRLTVQFTCSPFWVRTSRSTDQQRAWATLP